MTASIQLPFLAAIKELGLQDTDKEPAVRLTVKQVEEAAERVLNKFVSLILPDLTETDTIRYQVHKTIQYLISSSHRQTHLDA